MAPPFRSGSFLFIFTIQSKSNNMTFYDSFKHFIEVHKIHQHEIDSCFGKDYFKKNPMYNNERCINRLAKHMEMNIKVRTEHPTNATVQFTLV